MELSPASPALGTVVRGVDLRERLDPDDVAVLRAEIDASFLLHVPGQELSGDLLVWDNHALQHARPEAGSEHRRVVRRVCVGVAPDVSIFAARMVERGVQA